MKTTIDLRVSKVQESLSTRNRLRDRTVDELVGLAKGIAADTIINDEECFFLAQWLKENDTWSGDWPFKVIRSRVAEFLEDGTLDRNEHKELLNLITTFTHQIEFWRSFKNKISQGILLISVGQIDFKGKTFCFSGKCWCWERSRCKEATKEVGGIFTDTMSKSVDYLVVGFGGSKLFKHSPFGVKIETAMNMASKGHPVAIVAEDHWYNQIGNLIGPNMSKESASQLELL